VDFSASTVWWLLAGALVAAELATGTFYLLMLAVGAAAGALAAHGGAGVTMQIVAAAQQRGGATVAWHLKRSRQPVAEPADRNRDVNLDIGQPVQVTEWQPDGTARVHYRGAAWSVRLARGGPPLPGAHVIVAVQGSELHVAPAAPPSADT
jgi:membrane protein implicated in regulation of membrane protease activity